MEKVSRNDGSFEVPYGKSWWIPEVLFCWRPKSHSSLIECWCAPRVGPMEMKTEKIDQAINFHVSMFDLHPCRRCQFGQNSTNHRDFEFCTPIDELVASDIKHISIPLSRCELENHLRIKKTFGTIKIWWLLRFIFLPLSYRSPIEYVTKSFPYFFLQPSADKTNKTEEIRKIINFILTVKLACNWLFTSQSVPIYEIFLSTKLP
jgi:hypothetical protein